MTDITLPPGDGSIQRVEPVDIQQEMQRSYIDYAMSVIVGRALPEVRDGLKPVHRRVLYAMLDSGFRPDRSHAKSARSVAETMGNYHPHGDASIYDTLVRMAQPWSLRYPLVDGQGNFGSPGNDPPAAMRYCVSGNSLVRLLFGKSIRIGDIVTGAQFNSDNPIDLKVLDRHGNPVVADYLFHSGEHQTYTVRTTEGYEITGTSNHPLLCLVNVGGIPTLLWKLIGEIRSGDYVVLQRIPPVEFGPADWYSTMEALLFGAFISGGFVFQDHAGFNSLDRDYFTMVVNAYDTVVGGLRCISSRITVSGSTLLELDVYNLIEFKKTRLSGLCGQRSADKLVPDWLWHSPSTVKRAFLQALFEGEGFSSILSRNIIEISYSTPSERLAADVQQMLLEFGVVSERYCHTVNEYKVVIANRAQVEMFFTQVGFGVTKQAKLIRDVVSMSPCVGMDINCVPGLATFIRKHCDNRWVEEDSFNQHNVDCVQHWHHHSAEIVGHIADPDIRAIVTDLTDGRFYYARVASVTDTGIQPVFSLHVDTEDHSFLTNGFISHNTEARLTPLAMEMLREIDEETVDFISNYDGRVQEPMVLPSRFPNLLANGSGGIAVGMATNIPPHNLYELADAVFWCLENHDADEETMLVAVMERVKGPDFPTAGLIVGSQGIADAYKTGRGSIRIRGVVEVEEDSRGRTSLVITELPYQVNHDNFITSIAEQVRTGRLAGISNVEDQGSDRVGVRIVIEIKRDAVAKVVLNNLYKHTQLQTSFGANMLSIVDGVPRTLRLDQMICYYVEHQLDVIVRRTTYRLRKANERAHILRGLVKALDALDEVITLIRASQTVDIARVGVVELLDIDDIQAQAILDMQLRRLAALERQRIIDDLAKIEVEIADLGDILAKPERRRGIIRNELTEIAEKYGDDRRTRIIAVDGDVNDEDLIAREEVVVTITETGYAKRTKTDLYRSQKRGGKGVQGAGLKQDDIVRHFFVCSTHDWILFFTTQGRVYRAKAYELPEASRTARGQHVANLLAFQPEERIAQVIQIRSYEDAPYLVLATRAGLVKKSKLTDFDSNRSGGIVAINLRDNDELVGAVLCAADGDLLLVSANGQSIRFSATDEALRPMGRATSGVQGMRFNADDRLLSLNVVREDTYLLVATSGGYAKRTSIEEYPMQGRGGKGVLTVMYDRRRGSLVGAIVVDEDSELYAITSGGGVIRTTARQVRQAGRQTKGVRLMNLGEGDTLLAIARNAEESADGGVG
ncbi:DNA gyrase subunit A [Mycobacterium leprae Kyoto-2]|uniref:DNA gyrase subunit A n=2 Tax=Mycobacterium leprae TaxID=1769 RepID=A0AAD0KQK0_MYCLR|nr:intein-containing DNA gyrase subunit A [Mycobacterium leprae]AWV47024.1 intein-containing DNA gyrase subunit A [Mycobacterium leprae]OAR19555.1 DNA gyrase subunit A [Mycobacterium leprae 3125609]BBC16296.1 DNA gyrase subunit A [Mycobacterium leprae Kyoto-2]CAR70099.1 putative DNA gyrase subunit A [Mycobacterium leprae Br4923]